MSDKNTTAILGGGNVHYSLEEAAVDLDEILAALEEMKNDGITHVVMSSGNYRGAQWASITPDWTWASGDEDD